MIAQNAIVAALISTALISLAPNLLLLLFPRYASGDGEQSRLLCLGQAMAAGGLLGDVFLHTIPHASGEGEVGLWILLGFAVFLATDMVMRSFGQHHAHEEKKGESTHHHHKGLKASAVLLNLVADSMHNFTDGVAIGASFSTSNDTSTVLSLLKSRGGLATVSIMFHEIPHELGDFAFLVKNGFSKQQAIIAQFGTAVAAMAGTCVGLMLHEFAGETLIYITAGGFIYLAACTMLPELLEEKASLKFRMMQIAFFGTGVAFLYAVSLLEAMDHQHDGHGHSHGRNHHAEHSSTPEHGHDLHHHVEHFATHAHHHHGHEHHEHQHHGHNEHSEL
jgi:solute carrier family 39 (zinc transporter), member 7